MLKHNQDVVLELYNSLIGSLIELSLKFKKLDPLLGGYYTEASKKNDESLDYLRKVCFRRKNMKIWKKAAVYIFF